jgi:hypothetical protein
MDVWANKVEIDQEERLVVMGGTRTNRMANAEETIMAYQPGQWLSFCNTDDDGTPINAS